MVGEHPFGEEHGAEQGTRHFRPGARVHVCGLYAGMCEDVVVVGRHRGSNRYVRMVVPARRLAGFRPERVYSPRVVALMEHRADGCLPIEDEASARAWAEVLPWWGPPHFGKPGS